MTQMQHQEIHRPKGVCQLLGISMATFLAIGQRKKLTTVKISKRATGVMQSELDRFLADIRTGVE
ncbi:hypothetical protein [Methylocucumis oryzae]|uniref:Uncharacterized protein n=1 Tax=Methylocucumis oryzae TaxID=1632867 RepID=A0A0F3INM1_9GAMM|nr:hypothetical protein [Methylocucumis oryzae]KJV07169.1 hypothetical protein VZ94_06615 [Methylocucumis oryzae]